LAPIVLVPDVRSQWQFLIDYSIWKFLYKNLLPEPITDNIQLFKTNANVIPINTTINSIK